MPIQSPELRRMNELRAHVAQKHELARAAHRCPPQFLTAAACELIWRVDLEVAPLYEKFDRLYEQAVGR